jgi:hypothetical protein
MENKDQVSVPFLIKGTSVIIALAAVVAGGYYATNDALLIGSGLIVFGLFQMPFSFGFAIVVENSIESKEKTRTR